MSRRICIMGRHVGTVDSWESDKNTCTALGLVPVLALADGGFPAGDLCFEMLEGTVCSYNEDGEVTWTGDFVEILAKFPKC